MKIFETYISADLPSVVLPVHAKILSASPAVSNKLKIVYCAEYDVHNIPTAAKVAQHQVAVLGVGEELPKHFDAGTLSVFAITPERFLFVSNPSSPRN